MTIYCFTFSLGSPLAKYYVMITAEDELTARMHMAALFSSHWAGCYKLLDFQRQIAEYGYQPLAHVNYDASVRLGTNHEELSREAYNRLYNSPHADIKQGQLLPVETK